MSQIKATGGIKVSGGLRAGRFNEPPSWDTIAGSLGTPFESQAFSVTPGATDPDSFPSGGDVDYSLTSGSLPSGLTLNAETGEISGTPTAVGSDTLSSFTLRAEDGPIGANLVGKSAERDFSINVLNNVAPSFDQAADFSIGSVAELAAASLFQITATDPNTNPQTITFSEVGAVLTGDNLSLDSNGNVTGTPPDSGGTRVVTFTVRASDGVLTTDQDYKLTITDSQDPIWVTAIGLLATVNELEAISTITLEATDDNAVSYSVTSGALPGGLTLNSSNGEITGTPSNVAEDITSDFEVTATDTIELDFTARCFSIKVLNVIANSLRFNDDDSTELTRTPGVGDSTTTWTFSTWFKLGNIGIGGILFSAGADSSNITRLGFTAGDIFRFTHIDAASTTTDLRTTQVFRDPSAWYHLVAIWDTDNGTADDRHRLYINGTQIADFGTRTNPTSSKQGDVNTAVEHNIANLVGSTNLFDGYLSETYFVDGSALDPTNFGAFNTNGDWQPKEYSGGFGTNGFHLDYAVASITELYKNRDKIPKVKISRGAELRLRHFQTGLQPIYRQINKE
ncbi:hypothetical protein LCGC14_1383430 [marine sediment metagenome]|uniref:Uncharacterized protein n=1 Tax=marine sediment metagenome TaxID=412755 RepID=A0A0F9KMV1_9ZZZZ